MKKPFTPFPPGTVRGPYFSEYNGRAQYAVQTSGGWVYFHQYTHETNHAAALERANEYAKKQL